MGRYLKVLGFRFLGLQLLKARVFLVGFGGRGQWWLVLIIFGSQGET